MAEGRRRRDWRLGPAVEDFELTRGDDGADAVLVVRGELDLPRAHRLGAAINTVLGTRPKRLVIDLCDVELVDSTGLAVLVHARRRTLRQGVQLKLVCDIPGMLRVLRGVGAHVSST